MPGLVVRSPDWVVSTLLQWRPMSVLLACSALVGYSRFVANTVAVKKCMMYAGKLKNSTHECVECCSGTSRYLRGEYVAGCVYGGVE